MFGYAKKVGQAAGSSTSMGWEGRCGKRYYYRCVRVDGRPVKRYVGRGRAAEMAARQDDQARATRLEQGEAARVEQLRHAGADRALRDLRIVLQTLMQATLVGRGFYRHHRGEWRHRRGYES